MSLNSTHLCCICILDLFPFSKPPWDFRTLFLCPHSIFYSVWLILFFFIYLVWVPKYYLIDLFYSVSNLHKICGTTEALEKKSFSVMWVKEKLYIQACWPLRYTWLVLSILQRRKTVDMKLALSELAVMYVKFPTSPSDSWCRFLKCASLNVSVTVCLSLGAGSCYHLFSGVCH